MSYSLANYEPVADRLARFWAQHPAGRVATALVEHTDQRIVFRADVYRDHVDTQPAATGYAEEKPAARGVNATSALENCETSAVGRALANLGYAPSAAARPSREEMAKVQAHSTPPPAPPTVDDRMRELAHALRRRHGDDRNAARGTVEQILGQPIESAANLTPEQIDTVLTALQEPA